MTVTGIKDAYENYRKERSDDEINSQGGFHIDAGWMTIYQKAYQIWIKSRTSAIYNHYENVFSLNPTLTWTLTQTHWSRFGKRLNEPLER